MGGATGMVSRRRASGRHAMAVLHMADVLLRGGRFLHMRMIVMRGVVSDGRDIGVCARGQRERHREQGSRI